MSTDYYATFNLIIQNSHDINMISYVKLYSNFNKAQMLLNQVNYDVHANLQ